MTNDDLLVKIEGILDKKIEGILDKKIEGIFDKKIIGILDKIDEVKIDVNNRIEEVERRLVCQL